MRLVYKATGKPVAEHDAHTIGGHRLYVSYMPKPHKPDSEGKIGFKTVTGAEGPTYYCSVIGAEWIEREDRMPEDPPADFDPENPDPDEGREQREAAERERVREDGPQ